MKKIVTSIVSVFSLSLSATQVIPITTPKLSAMRPDIAQMLTADARQRFLRLIQKYQPSPEQCRTLTCEEEGLNAAAMGEKEIEPIIAHLVAGYKKVWLLDGDEGRPKLNALLKERAMRLLFNELHITHMLFPTRELTQEEIANFSLIEFALSHNSLLYLPEGERNAILFYKSTYLRLQNQYLKRHLLGHDEQDIIEAYELGQKSDDGCSCFGEINSWKKIFEHDKAEALKWIEEHSKDYKEWFKTQNDRVTLHVFP